MLLSVAVPVLSQGEVGVLLRDLRESWVATLSPPSAPLLPSLVVGVVLGIKVGTLSLLMTASRYCGKRRRDEGSILVCSLC